MTDGSSVGIQCVFRWLDPLKWCIFQVYIMVSSPLLCWWLCWSFSCWQELRCSLTRGTLYVLGGFPQSAVLITDKPARSQMEMCWLQTWGITLDNSSRWLFCLAVRCSPSIISPSGINATWRSEAVTPAPQDGGEMMTASSPFFSLITCQKDVGSSSPSGFSHIILMKHVWISRPWSAHKCLLKKGNKSALKLSERGTEHSMFVVKFKY